MPKITVDFNRDSMEGQMKPEERRAMYDLVVKNECLRMLEIGTWKGGGSTYILSCAAMEYGGCLHTIEADESFYNHAVKLFETKMQILKPFVTFHYGTSDKIIPHLIKNGGFNFVLFDGAEDADQTVKEYDLLNKTLGINSFIACHDWNTSKMRKMRQVLANDNSWQAAVSMPNTETGFMILKRAV